MSWWLAWGCQQTVQHVWNRDPDLYCTALISLLEMLTSIDGISLLEVGPEVQYPLYLILAGYQVQFRMVPLLVHQMPRVHVSILLTNVNEGLPLLQKPHHNWGPTPTVKPNH